MGWCRLDAGTVADDPTDSACSLASPNAQLIPVTVAAGTTYARFSLLDADVNPGTDLDLCVFLGRHEVGSSGSGTSAEEVNLASRQPGPTPSWCRAGAWWLDAVQAVQLGPRQRGGRQHDALAPAAAPSGYGRDHLSFSGLAAATKYLGSVAYAGAAGMPSPTIVRVDTP